VNILFCNCLFFYSLIERFCKNVTTHPPFFQIRESKEDEERKEREEIFFSKIKKKR